MTIEIFRFNSIDDRMRINFQDKLSNICDFIARNHGMQQAHRYFAIAPVPSMHDNPWRQRVIKAFITSSALAIVICIVS